MNHFGKARLINYTFFTLVYGGFALVGTPIESGGINNIRDLSPMIAGLVAGPVISMSVGLLEASIVFF